jgi:hypothetical protein
MESNGLFNKVMITRCIILTFDKFITSYALGWTQNFGICCGSATCLNLYLIILLQIQSGYV